MKHWSDYRDRLRALLFPALLGPSQLLLFGPFVTYSTNQEEFAVGFWTLAGQWLWMLAPIVALLIGVGLLLTDWVFRHYVAALFGFGVLSWVQGTLLVPDYGVLYGEGLDLSLHAWRAPYEIALWVGGLSLAALFARRVSNVAPFASLLLVTLQAVVLVVPSFSSDESTQMGGAGWRRPPEEMYDLSRTQNVFHIVLDGFVSEIFGELLAEERATFDRDFSGFVFFADHLGAFPTTRASMPAMFTGVAYRNEMPLDDFISAGIGGRSIFTVLAAQGFQIHSVTFHPRAEHPPESLSSDGGVVRYNIPTPYGSYRDYVEFSAAQLLDLTLFRHASQAFKSRVYNDQEWLLQRRYAERRPPDQAARGVRPSNHAAFFEEFTRRMTVAVDTPVYNYIHIAIPHPPTVVEADCSFQGPRRSTRRRYTAQARCAIAVVQKFLDRLRTLDVYDDSVIVLASDHGWRVRRGDHPLRRVRSPAGDLDRVALQATPLLAVKPAGRTGPLESSYAPTAITDIPATIFDLAGLSSYFVPGVSVFDVDPNARRPRPYAQHSWENADWTRRYFDRLLVFSVDGRVTDPSAWTFEKAVFEPSADLEAQLARYEVGFYEVEQGRDGPFQWGDVQAVTYAPPYARTYSVDARKAPGSTVPQTLTVRIDGQVVDQRELSDDEWHGVRLELEPRGQRGTPFCIELLVDPPWHDENERRLGVMYRNSQWLR